MKDLACSMCLMRARIGVDGMVYLAFRTAVDNIRDFYVLTSKVGENAFGLRRQPGQLVPGVLPRCAGRS